ncbi:Bug family tripartite tricarboxylate transporter substrate binding protein [Cupriavidus campinensis]
MKLRYFIISIVHAFAATLPFSVDAIAQSKFPAKPLKIVVSGAPGSVADMLVRPLADEMGKSLGVPVIVDNKPGAGGIVAVNELMSRPADGYTVMLVGATQLIWNQYFFPKLTYKPKSDFTAVSMVSGIPMVLAVNPALPVQTLDEFVAYSKSHPGKINYGFGNTGSPAHVAFELFRAATGADAVPIAYKSGPDAVQGLMSGDIQVMLDGMPLLEPYIKSGRLRPLGVATAGRLASLPNVPSFAEKGYPRAEADIWVGIVARSGTDSVIVSRLSDEIRKALKRKNIEEIYGRIGAISRPSTAEEFAAFIEHERKKWGDVIEKSGIKLQ